MRAKIAQWGIGDPFAIHILSEDAI